MELISETAHLLQHATMLAQRIGILIFAYYATLTIYRLYFHPLAKYPGPKIRAISGLPAAISLLRGRMPMNDKLLHDKYGRIVRTGPNELIFDSPQAWEDIYGHRNGHITMEKDPVHVGSITPLGNASPLTQSSRADHPRLRRGFTHAFSLKALSEQEPDLQKYVDKFIIGLAKLAKNNEVVNLASWFNFITFDVIGDLAFGEPFGCLDSGDFHFWVLGVFQTIRAGAFEQGVRRIAGVSNPLQRLLMNFIPREMRQHRRSHFEYSKTTTQKRLNTETDRKDFMFYTLRQRDKKAEVTDDEILVNMALFIVAGSETTASLMTGMMAYLLRDRRSFDILTEEVRSTFNSEDQIQHDKLNSLPYLNACIEEGLRVFPPVPLGLMRIIPEGGDVIDGHYLRAGTSVSCSNYASGHSDHNFKKAGKFIPERWISSEYESDLKKGVHPFSLGPRGCIGRNLASLEIRIIIARLLWNFDIELADDASFWDPDGEMKNMKAYLTWSKTELYVKLKKRQIAA